MVESFFCGSFQSLLAMEFRMAKDWWRLIPAVAGDDQRRRNQVTNRRVLLGLGFKNCCQSPRN
jgi:hypothetical protein